MHRCYCVAIPGWRRLTVLTTLLSVLAVGYVYADPLPAAAQPVQPQPGQLTPTPTSSTMTVTPVPSIPGVPGVPPRPSPVTTTAASSSPATDAIANVAQTVGQIARDPSMAVETKAQQITALATQFNLLVAQWQQHQAALGLAAPPGIVTPQPSTSTCGMPCSGTTGTAPGVTGVGALMTPTPRVEAFPATGGASTADQLRAQLAAVTQQMSQVSLDTTLTNDARVQQLNALSAQFNQLMTQLQGTP